jgi:propionyl-CoA carboxylase alpha chain
MPFILVTVLSENADFAEEAENNIIFIGPKSKAIKIMEVN